MKEFETLSRRGFIKLGSVGLLGLAASGCSSTAIVGQAKPQVVIVGGGWGGASAARALAKDGRVAVTLIEPNKRFMSCPLSAHYIAGHHSAEHYQRGYENIDKAGIRRIQEKAIDIDRTARVVVTESKRISYDYLILSMGVDYMEGAVEGYSAARDQIPVGFRAFEQMAVKKQVDAFLAKGGEFVMTVPKPPYRCPVAPYERAALIAEQVKLKGVKGKVIIIDENPNPMPPPTSKPIMSSLQTMYKDQIEYRPNVTVTGVNAGNKTLVTSAGEMQYSHINMILPMRAPELVRKTGLGERWAKVTLPNFQSADDERIFIIGDMAGLNVPKTGNVAFDSGQAIAVNIIKLVQGGSLGSDTRMPTGVCWAYMSNEEAVGVTVTTSWESGPKAKLSFNVDAQANKNSGVLGHRWGETMWNNMFG